MTLRQAQQMPGFYGRLVKPWKPYSDEPLMHEIVLVRADRTILDANPMRPISPDASPYDDWQPVDATLLLSSNEGWVAAALVLAGIPRDEALYRATEYLKKSRPSS